MADTFLCLYALVVIGENKHLIIIENGFFDGIENFSYFCFLKNARYYETCFTFRTNSNYYECRSCPILFRYL